MPSIPFTCNAAVHPGVAAVTERIAERSKERRARYLALLGSARAGKVGRAALSCTNLAHAMAAMPSGAKILIQQTDRKAAPNLAIVSAYNDILSAHQPLQEFPRWLKEAAAEVGASAQFAGGVPAMCDGVTQGQAGMELSLFSRDVIAMATAVALSHQMFDAGLYLGVCDKIVPGLLIGALAFGHLPGVFVPAGPMTSGLANDEKARVRQDFAQGLVGREALLDAEMRAYHGPGTCTFYGTANSNQMLMEVMGLHVPGSAFVHPGTPLREALTREAARRAAALAARPQPSGLGEWLDPKALVNGVVGLLATGGSTNHTLHLIAIGRAAGIELNWTDFDDLSRVVPLLARVYPNGKADINAFHAAGGMGFLIRELLDAGLLHPDVETAWGAGLTAYTREPWLDGGRLAWRDAPQASLSRDILRPVAEPFAPDGGIRLLQGKLGRAVIKVSAVTAEHRVVQAPVRIFDEQDDVIKAFDQGTLDRDGVIVVRFQGPAANGMPELHKLTPALTILQERGWKVALLTDGRMSGASGKVPAAIHATPEAARGGPLARLRDGDMVRLDAVRGELDVLVDATEWAQRTPVQPDLASRQFGAGRELFAGFRQHVDAAEEGAGSFQHPLWARHDGPVPV